VLAIAAYSDPVARRVRALAALAAAPLVAVLVGCGTDGHVSPQAGPVSHSTPLAADPSSPTAAPSTPTAAARAAGKPRSLFFGDSYIIGGAYTGPQNSMGAIAARRLGWKYQIRGGGGTGFVAGNPDYAIPSFIGQIRAGALDVGPVDWLVIEGGGNDKYDDPGLVTRRAVRTLKAAAKRHPEARLVLVGTMDPTVDSFTDTDAVIGAMAAAARKVGIPYINAQHWLEGRPELVGPDYDHPTPAGHRLCGSKLAKALRALE
jgi:lysophospholipase L1-like esterase